MIKRLLPHPLLTALLTLVWMLLEDALSLGVFIFAVILGVLIPILTAPYWPHRARLNRPLKLLVYLGIAVYDIVVANVVVAMTVLFKSNRAMKPAWVAVPLDLRRPEAITMLAGTITLTPGTVSADLSQTGTSLLVHCLDAPDPDEVRNEIKQRYERRLKEIFE